MPDVRHAGFRVLGDGDAGRDEGAAIVGREPRNGVLIQVDVIAHQHDFLAGSHVARIHHGLDGIADAIQELLVHVLFGGIEGQQGLLAIAVDTRDGTDALALAVFEVDDRAAALVALLQRLADFIHAVHFTLNVDHIVARLAGRHKLTQILEHNYPFPLVVSFYRQGSAAGLSAAGAVWRGGTGPVRRPSP